MAENRKRNTEEREKKTGRRAFGITTFSLLAMMVLISLMGLVFFKIWIQGNDVDGAEQAPAVYRRYYAMITSDDKDDFWQAVYRGAKEEGEQEGAFVELFASDVGTQYSMEERMEIAIASGVDGIILEGSESSALRNAVSKAQESGIPVVTASNDMAESGRISFVGVSQYDLGQTYGRQTCELAENMLAMQEEGEPLRILVLVSQKEKKKGQNLLLSGIREELARNETLQDKVSVETYAISDRGAFAATAAIRNIFVGNEEVPDILVCLSRVHTSCAYQAVVDYNKVGITNIIGYYDSTDIVNAIDKEIIYSTVSMDAQQMGRCCAMALSEYGDVGYVSEYFTVDTYVVNKESGSRDEEESE